MELSIFWHRRDLRIADNTGLFQALNSGKRVQPIFIFDTEILEKLESKSDARVQFIHTELSKLKEEYQKIGSDLLVFYGRPMEVWKELISDLDVRSVFTNHDYEPYSKERDRQIADLLVSKKITFQTFKDHTIFEREEVLKADGSPYTVFTPYSKKWKAKLNEQPLIQYPSEKHLNNLSAQSPIQMMELKEIGFEEVDLRFPEKRIDLDVISEYEKTRDIPSIKGTTRLSVHLRFGTLSIRELVKLALQKNEKWLNELIWRDFYMMILHHFPHVVNSAFRAKYDRIEWRNNEKEFEAWCKGNTGYPIVDAGMRELNKTGFMHNRVRMVVASFLTKHLLIDWRWGEVYFAQKLLDFELSSNNGGWQWASGSGCDAAPYFRVFNPYLQTKRFDPDLKYTRKWVPEFEDLFTYPKPIVEHKFARNRALETYRKYLNMG